MGHTYLFIWVLHVTVLTFHVVNLIHFYIIPVFFYLVFFYLVPSKQISAAVVQSCVCHACGKLGVRILVATDIIHQTGSDCSTVKRMVTGVSVLRVSGDDNTNTEMTI